MADWQLGCRYGALLGGTNIWGTSMRVCLCAALTLVSLRASRCAPAMTAGPSSSVGAGTVSGAGEAGSGPEQRAQGYSTAIHVTHSPSAPM